MRGRGGGKGERERARERESQTDRQTDLLVGTQTGNNIRNWSNTEGE